MASKKKWLNKEYGFDLIDLSNVTDGDDPVWLDLYTFSLSLLFGLFATKSPFLLSFNEWSFRVFLPSTLFLTRQTKVEPKWNGIVYYI